LIFPLARGILSTGYRNLPATQPVCFPGHVETFPPVAGALSMALEKFPPAVRKLSKALEKFPPAVGKLSKALETFPPTGGILSKA
jgi:hypothetical protein